MLYVSEIQNVAPEKYLTSLQEKVYQTLNKLQIPFERVDTDKPFRSKDFSTALNIARVSFAPAELMETVLGTKIGAATIFSCLLDTERKVNIVFDKAVLEKEWYGCSDGTTTGYMKVKMDDIYRKFLSFTKHMPSVIEV